MGRFTVMAAGGKSGVWIDDNGVKSKQNVDEEHPLSGTSAKKVAEPVHEAVIVSEEEEVKESKSFFKKDSSFSSD